MSGSTTAATRSAWPAPRRFLRGLFFLGLALVAGCATPPTRPRPADVEAAWQTHRSRLAELTTWHLLASLALRTEREGGQANMDWHQREREYDIRLSGPFGSGAVRLAGDDQGATLFLSNGKRLADPSPAQLLYDQLGWWIPVDSLRYWAVGLPDPALPSRWSLDAYGRLAALEQDGWQVRFESYMASGAIDLPQKVTIEGHDAQVRMVTRRWTLAGAEVP